MAERAPAARRPLPSHPAADAAGIGAIPVPTPFAVGRMNAWLLRGDPLTLVDTGPNSATAWLELEAGLERLGVHMAEIEIVLLTHQHVDHVGLTGLVAERSGAEVWALDGLVRTIEEGPARERLESEFNQALLRRHGVPADVVVALGSVGEQFRAWSAPMHAHRGLRDGEDVVLGGRTWRVAHRPGHSPSDTVLLDRDGSGLAIGGDHLLADVSSNPLATLALDATDADPAARAPALRQYVASMRETARDDLVAVLPGHGQVVTDHRGLIDGRLAHHEKRKARIAGLLAEHGAQDAFALAGLIWGDLRLKQALLTVSEVLGHLDLLVDDGTVASAGADADGVEHWVAT